jgi:uncharacterized membrane protein YagU involved in acid resistance
MSKILTGALAGFAATFPMTAAMTAMHRLLPTRERYPLPPKQITVSAAERAGAEDHLGETEREVLTAAAHFGYGATMGALYAPLADKGSLSGATRGAGFGLAVWAGSYLGLLPALGLLNPATEHPARRNGLMITAHLIWGAILGVLVERAGSSRN